MFPKRSAWTRLPVPIFIPFGVRKALMATATDFLLLEIGWLSQRFAALSEQLGTALAPSLVTVNKRLARLFAGECCS